MSTPFTVVQWAKPPASTQREERLGEKEGRQTLCSQGVEHDFNDNKSALSSLLFLFLRIFSIRRQKDNRY